MTLMPIMRYLVAFLGIGSIFGALILGEQTSAQPSPPRGGSLVSLPAKTQPSLPPVTADPFVPLGPAVAFASSTDRKGSAPPAAASANGQASTVVPAPASAGQSPSATSAVVVLCGTYASDTRPSAAFLVGNDAVIAGPGDEVGGYRVRSILLNQVIFEDGRSLELADCSVLNGQSTGAPVPMAPPGAQLPPPSQLPAVAAPASAPQVNVAVPPGFTIVRRPTPSPLPTADAGAYSDSLYGQPLSTAPPTPLVIQPRRTQ